MVGTSRTKFTREVSGEVEESMPEIAVPDTALPVGLGVSRYSFSGYKPNRCWGRS